MLDNSLTQVETSLLLVATSGRSGLNLFEEPTHSLFVPRSEHAKELGNAVPTSPFYFLKPTSSYLANGGVIEVPKGCEVHHESKLHLKGGKGINPCSIPE